MLEGSGPILEVEGLVKRFAVRKPWMVRALAREPRRYVHAVEGVTFAVPRGTTFALVGESGCGKSTIARCIAGILPPTTGSITFMGRDITRAAAAGAETAHRRHLQMIFQDPYASLNPRWRVARIIAEPIVTHGLLAGKDRIAARVEDLLRLVGLSAPEGRKYPHQFSGGQRQRISIARALASEPDFLVCDEPTSALDVSVQAQILNLMRSLQRRLGLTYLLISHNLAVVAHMADAIGVMYLGRLVEWGDAQRVFERPLHPYTRMMFEAIPDLETPGRRRQPLRGEVPSPLAPPPGCAFHPRCAYADARCARERPLPVARGATTVACHAVEENRLPDWARPSA
ncbi:MAG: ABC transporter ATP-binding protein [Proteobacteria bacterium]|nr:MAG: ABC transporter ATP-binding protein [Pseudomonadota bacterium]